MSSSRQGHAAVAGPVPAGRVAAWVRRHPFASFYLLAVAFPTLLFSYLVLVELRAPNLYGPGVGLVKHFYATKAALESSAPLLSQHPDSVLLFVTLYTLVPLGAPFFFFPFAPTVSALLVTALGRGRAAVAALLGAFAPVRGALGWRDALRMYGLLVLFIAALFGGVTGYEAWFNGGARLAQMRRLWWPDDAALWLAGWGAALLFNQGALLEELGWRGYAWPLLARRLAHPLLAAVLLGVAWALWHFPREIPTALAGQLTLGGLWRSQVVFIAMCVGMSLVAIAFVNHTGGSVWPAILVHGCLNSLGAGLKTAQVGVRSDIPVEGAVIWLIAGGLALLVAGPDLGWRRRLQLHGGDGRSDPSLRWSRPAERP